MPERCYYYYFFYITNISSAEVGFCLCKKYFKQLIRFLLLKYQKTDNVRA